MAEEPNADIAFYLKQRSLRALRKLLIAFRSAAHMNEDDQVLAWSIDNSSGALSPKFDDFLSP